MKHSELSGTTKVALLHDAPKEYRGGWAQNALRVPQPTITAQFRDSHTVTTTASAGSPAKCTLHQANYDYKAHGFTVPGETKAGAGGHPVIVARMNSYGAVSAPTGRNSSPGAVPGLSHASHASGGFSGSSAGSNSHSSGGGGSSSGGGAAHSSGGGGKRGSRQPPLTSISGNASRKSTRTKSAYSRSGIVAAEGSTELHRAEAELIAKLIGCLSKLLELLAPAGFEQLELFRTV